jgi:xanthine dehydrogenase accessory factor
MIQKVGFLVSVADDRPDFLRKEHFPDVADVHVEDMKTFAGRLPSRRNTYVVRLSRAFARDKAILGELLEKDFRHIWMIGCRRKMKNIIKGLKEEGIPDGASSVVKSPVGLDIGAETPEEIAISIAAEILAVKKGGGLAFPG